MLRSLQKAKYSNESVGHFGLAAKYYCHFTSPIRRYPDLIIHRIMKAYLKGSMNEQKINQLEGILPEIAKQCSERERMADEAERESKDLKKVEYMKANEGEVFEGIISNVTNFSMFIEMDNTIEGLVRMSSMEDDYYNYDDRHFCLIGERTRKTYRIGDEVKVLLAKADISTKKIEFVLVETMEESELKRLSGNTDNNNAYSKSKKAKSSSENRKPISNSDRASKTSRNNSDKKSARRGKAIDKKVLDKITGKGKRKKKDLNIQ